MPPPELAALQQRAAGIGVALDDLRGKRLLAYLDLLERWNRTYNLTAVRERDAMREQHLLDCLAVVPPLRRRLTRSGRVLDVETKRGRDGDLQYEIKLINARGEKQELLIDAATGRPSPLSPPLADQESRPRIRTSFLA